MVRNIVFCCLFFLSIHSYSQDIDYSLFTGKSVKVSITLRLDQPYFYQYKDSSYQSLRFIYNSGFNSSSSTPEDIIVSQYCGSNKGLKQVPVYSGSKPDTTNRNGLILIHKLTFFWQGTETAIVKFAEMRDSIIGKPGFVQLQHVGNSWQPSNIVGVKNIENVILSIRTNIFWDFYSKKSELPAINEAYSKVKDEEGFLNIDLLSDYLNQVRKNNPALYNQFCDN